MQCNHSRGITLKTDGLPGPHGSVSARSHKRRRSHLLSGQCSVYGDLTHKYSDFTEDNSLVQFFNEVLARRDALQKERTTLVGVGDTIVGANPIDNSRISQS